MPQRLPRFLFFLILTLAAVAAAPSSAPARVDWKGDAERPWNEEWASYSCESRSRFARVFAPRNQLDKAYRFEVRDGDDSYGERCELGQGNPRRSGFPLFQEGEERWISYQVYLPHGFPIYDYPIDAHSWNVIHQLKQLGSLGTPALSMEVQRGRFYLMKSNHNRSSCCTHPMWSGRARGGRWVKFTMHVKFSPNPDVGFVELFGDLSGGGQRRLMRKVKTHTMKRDGTGRTVPSHSRIGIYRDRRLSGTAQIYFDGYTVATDRATAERRAFQGPSFPPPVGLLDPGLGDLR